MCWPSIFKNVKNETSVNIGTGIFEDVSAPVPQLIYEGNRVYMFFSLAIFTGLNLTLFTIVSFCYTAIFISVRLSSKRAGLEVISSNEIRMAKKLFLLVLTDFCTLLGNNRGVINSCPGWGSRG